MHKKTIKSKNNISVQSENSMEETRKINKGFGAGGANTNKNGLSYEKLTDLSSNFTIIETNKNSSKIKFKNNKTEFIRTCGSHFLKYMNKHENKEIPIAHGCKRPDECYVDEKNKIIFIIEKKFQTTGGSVCEKIQTVDYKKSNFIRRYPDFDTSYIYCLSDWFKKNCEAELEYKNIPVFWGNSETYKDDIINFMINYKK